LFCAGALGLAAMRRRLACVLPGHSLRLLTRAVLVSRERPQNGAATVMERSGRFFRTLPSLRAKQ
jgi:hypothetical protein